MDPNSALQWINEAWVRFDAAADHPNEQLAIAREIHDYWDGLDQWMRRGGYLPYEWGDERR